jgi:hypothetical protein
MRQNSLNKSDDNRKMLLNKRMTIKAILWFVALCAILAYGVRYAEIFVFVFAEWGESLGRAAVIGLVCGGLSMALNQCVIVGRNLADRAINKWHRSEQGTTDPGSSGRHEPGVADWLSGRLMPLWGGMTVRQACADTEHGFAQRIVAIALGPLFRVAIQLCRARIWIRILDSWLIAVFASIFSQIMLHPLGFYPVAEDPRQEIRIFACFLVCWLAVGALILLSALVDSCKGLRFPGFRLLIVCNLFMINVWAFLCVSQFT